MKISVLLPTRKRFESMKNSVQSLRDHAVQAELEILLAIDQDDRETIDRYHGEGLAGSIAVVGPRRGYINLHEYVNELCEKSTGDWLLLWNDDALMTTQAWDEIVSSYTGKFLVLNPETNHAGHPRHNCIFPIVPRKWFELLGHFALSNHNDTYVEQIANTLGIREDVPIYVRHDRADLTGGNNDEVYAEREFTTGSFFGGENQANICRDIEVLRGSLTGALR